MNRRESIFFISLAVALFSLLTVIYLPSFNNAFQFDDQHTIVDNLQIRDLDNPLKFFVDPKMISVLPSNQVYRPLSVLSLALDYRLAGGLNPRVFHRSMYIIFCLQLIAMFFLVSSVLKLVRHGQSRPFNSFASLLITFLYGFNTALAETLNYISARSDSYSTFFAVVTLAMFARGGWLRKYLIYLIPLVLGMFTKETGATVPALIFAYEFLFSTDISFFKRFRSALVASIPAFSTLALFLLLYFTISIAAPPPGDTTILSYFVTQIYVTAHYLLMFFLPVHLSADSDLKVVTDLLDERVLLAGVLHLFLLAMIVRGIFNRKLAPISFGLVWFYVALSPTSSFIRIEDVQNDHRMFYPFVGLALAVGWLCLLVYQATREKLGVTVVNLLLSIVYLGYLSGHYFGLTSRHQVWLNHANLWHDVTIKSPNNARGLMNYGIHLMERGNFVGAKSYFDRALKIWPNYAYLHLNLAILFGAQELNTEADREYRLAIGLNPGNPTGYLFYANWLFKKERYQEALLNVDIVLNMSPEYLGAKELRDKIVAITSR